MIISIYIDFICFYFPFVSIHWLMGDYMLPLGVQAVLLICYIIWDVILIYFIYKRLIYKHLDNIKKNIEELKDICTE